MPATRASPILSYICNADDHSNTPRRARCDGPQDCVEGTEAFRTDRSILQAANIPSHVLCSVISGIYADPRCGSERPCAQVGHSYTKCRSAQHRARSRRAFSSVCLIPCERRLFPGVSALVQGWPLEINQSGEVNAPGKRAMSCAWLQLVNKSCMPSAGPLRPAPQLLSASSEPLDMGSQPESRLRLDGLLIRRRHNRGASPVGQVPRAYVCVRRLVGQLLPLPLAILRRAIQRAVLWAWMRLYWSGSGQGSHDDKAHKASNADGAGRSQEVACRTNSAVMRYAVDTKAISDCTPGGRSSK